MIKNQIKILITICLTFQLILGSLLITPKAYAFSDEQQLVLQAWRTINQAYLDNTFNHQNWYALREKLIKQPLNNQESAYQAIEKMLASLDEPFTRLLRPEQYRSLQVNTAGELSGIGLQIGLESKTGQLEVIAPLEGSPAANAGIKPHEIILEIDGLSTKLLSLDEAAARMRGKAGTNVGLILQDLGGEEREVILTREKINLSPVIAEIKQDKNNHKIGYIRLSQFSAKAPADVAKAIKKFENKKVKGYILDLRNNPGGLLQAGIDVGREFLNEGTIVYTVNRQGVLDSYDANNTALTNAPLIVLVNQGTASASEILAGALQDLGRGILVGEKTFGKGLIQSLFDLPDGSGLAVTVAKYETPNHRDIHKLGITPDYLITNDDPTIDAQYQKAIELIN